MSYQITVCPSDFAPFLHIGESNKYKAYLKYAYDFTFDNRYIVYHYTRPFINSCEYVYVVLDLNNYRTSQMFAVQTPVDSSHYASILPALLFSIKYNGDRRYAAF